MSRENTCTLVGRISAKAITFIEDFGTYKIGFNLSVLRKNGRVDYPRVVIYGLNEKRARKLWDNLKENYFAIVRGMISTRMITRSFICPMCGKERTINSLVTEIVAFSPPVILKENYNADEFYEIANSISLLGWVCSAEVQHPNDNVTMYQIAVERRFTVKEQGETNKDFPWIKSFAENAVSDAKFLTHGSQIYIRGSVQTREFQRAISCEDPVCDGKSIYTETVAEVISTNNEYLHNCNVSG